MLALHWRIGIEVIITFNKESVREVRKDKQQFSDGVFPDEQSLLSIIDSKLFAKEQDEGLKKYYRALIGYAFHQGGFPYASPFLVVNQFGCILADGDKGKKPAAALGSPTKVKNFIMPMQKMRCKSRRYALMKL